MTDNTIFPPLIFDLLHLHTASDFHSSPGREQIYMADITVAHPLCVWLTLCWLVWQFTEMPRPSQSFVICSTIEERRQLLHQKGTPVIFPHNYRSLLMLVCKTAGAFLENHHRNCCLPVGPVCAAPRAPTVTIQNKIIRNDSSINHWVFLRNKQ